MTSQDPLNKATCKVLSNRTSLVSSVSSVASLSSFHPSHPHGHSAQ